jgi:hypothetical protein
MQTSTLVKHARILHMQIVDSRNMLMIPYLKGASGTGFLQKASPSDQSIAKQLQESRVPAAQKPACSSA